MKKVVVSWMAYHRDFAVDGRRIQVDPAGPTIRIYNEYYGPHKYNTHFLLQCNPSEGSDLERRIKVLTGFIKERFPSSSLELHLLNIEESELSNYELVSAQLRNFLNKIDPDTLIDIVVGTGTEILKFSWITLFYSMERNFNLFLMHHDLVKYPDLIPIPIKKNKLLDSKLREAYIGETISKRLVSDLALDKAYNEGLAYSKAIEQNILLLGETGTGKGELAKFIFENSPLKSKPFININCASLPEDTMLYSELFGHSKGAFTGANKSRDGLFVKCKGGTLFMDEVGDISLKMQLSLLRAIENYEIKPLGSDDVIQDVKVRIIAATNSDLYEKCQRNEFRWDLYYRLHECVIQLPSFRERTQDERTKIINQFITTAELKWGKKLNLSADAKNVFYEYHFPGNFREMKNSINALFASEKKTIDVSDLPRYFTKSVTTNIESIAAIEKNHIERIYKASNYVMNETARRLDYKNPYQLKKKMEKLGIKIIH